MRPASCPGLSETLPEIEWLDGHSSSLCRWLGRSVVRQARGWWSPCVHAEVHPVLTKELGGMQRRHAAVTANQGVRRAIPVAAPADALGVGRIHRNPLVHRSAPGRSWTSDLSNCGNSTLFSSWMCASKSSANCLVAVQSWTQVRQASPGGVA